MLHFCGGGADPHKSNLLFHRILTLASLRTRLLQNGAKAQARDLRQEANSSSVARIATQ
jgi:hypothetical protein